MAKRLAPLWLLPTPLMPAWQAEMNSMSIQPVSSGQDVPPTYQSARGCLVLSALVLIVLIAIILWGMFFATPLE